MCVLGESSDEEDPAVEAVEGRNLWVDFLGVCIYLSLFCLQAQKFYKSVLDLVARSPPVLTTCLIHLLLHTFHTPVPNAS